MSGDAIRVQRYDGPVDGTVVVPGSKSIANRALVCAALAEGVSRLSNLPDGDDVTAMLTALGELGAQIDHTGGTAEITGWGGGSPATDVAVTAGLAGTTSRFLVALAAAAKGPIVVDGSGPMRTRPFGPLFAALTDLGADIGPLTETNLPVRISGPAKGGAVTLRGDVSSQFISALMMIGPMLSGGLLIRIDGDLVSRPYVELTASTMSYFGAAASVGDHTIEVPEARYVAADLYVEPDASSAGYPFGIAAIVGGRVEVPGLPTDSLQADARFLDALAGMGCVVTSTDTGTRLERSPDYVLRGIDIDIADISDQVPTLASVACFASSPTRIEGVGFIRRKESDRLGDLTHEWRKLGARVSEIEDGLYIEPSTEVLSGGAVDPHHDHRLAMGAALIGVATGGVEVDDPSVVSKSWPGFWSMVDHLRTTCSPGDISAEPLVTETFETDTRPD